MLTLHLKLLSRCKFSYSNINLICKNYAKESLTSKLKYFFGYNKLRFSKQHLTDASVNLYTVAAEYPDFEECTNVFQLPKTYNTWFLIMNLHSWLIINRCLSEGEDGKFVLEEYFKMLYDDVPRRFRGFAVSKRKETLDVLYGEMCGLMVSLDEGLVSGEDSVMAAALWRNFYNGRDDNVDPILLEQLLVYVWKQVQHLRGLRTDDLFWAGQQARLTFLPMHGERLNVEVARQRLEHCFTRPDKILYV